MPREKLSITPPFSAPLFMKSVKNTKQFLCTVAVVEAYSSLLSIIAPAQPPRAEVTLRIWVDYRCIIKCNVNKTVLRLHGQLYPFTYLSILKSQLTVFQSHKHVSLEGEDCNWVLLHMQ